MNATATTAALGKEIRDRGFVAPDGTVVTVTLQLWGETRTHAAMWMAAERRWRITSEITPALTNSAFFDWLAEDNVVDIAVATAWEQVER